MTAFAAIDVGSNAIRLAIGAVDNNNQLFIVENFRESIRLGQEVFSVGTLSDQTIERVAAAFQNFRSAIEHQKVKKIRAVATSALREAKNRDALIERVQKRSNITIEVISGEEEARLVSEAVRNRVNLKGKRAMLIDIGGGSIEISVMIDEDVVSAESVKMGTVRLLQILEEKKRGQKIFNRLVEEYANGLKHQLRRDLDGKVPDIAIGTGGNFDALADLKKRVLKKDNDSELSAADMKELNDKLTAATYQERVEKFGLREDRADVIIPATIVVQQILKHTKISSLIVPRVGLKEGVLLEMMPQPSSFDPEKHRKQVLAFARVVGERFSIDVDHAKLVMRFSAELFDDFKSLHGLDHEARFLLEVAAYLHDVGRIINANNHHRHSAYIIRSTPFVGLTERQRLMVAAMARYHRKAPPKEEHEEIEDLVPADRETITKLASLLRLAEGLDKGHLGAVRSFKTNRSGSEIIFTLQGERDLLLERWAVVQKSDLFQECYGLSVRVSDENK